MKSSLLVILLSIAFSQSASATTWICTSDTAGQIEIEAQSNWVRQSRLVVKRPEGTLNYTWTGKEDVLMGQNLKIRASQYLGSSTHLEMRKVPDGVFFHAFSLNQQGHWWGQPPVTSETNLYVADELMQNAKSGVVLLETIIKSSSPLGLGDKISGTTEVYSCTGS
ncbi:MAG: hypothetical protein ACXVA9_03055 [Bdellovibrionales bacterium]